MIGMMTLGPRGNTRSDERMRSGRRGIDPWDDDFYR
jgi:molecular chaperone DnaK